ncbi:unnamed protein product [Urochloa decumbens]|uniref:Transmembrane protein 230 n=1 Tax=Urochloa decumbens TaxID=240449 RepID=A0ABC9G0E1_9POAL
MSTKRNVQYSPVPTEDRDDQRFKYTPKSHRKIPWKSITLAFFLLLIGISLLSLSYFIFTSHMEGDGSQAYMVSYSWVCLLSFLAITRLELLTIPGEEHQGTPSHPSQIISHLCFHKCGHQAGRLNT